VLSPKLASRLMRLRLLNVPLDTDSTLMTPDDLRWKEDLDDLPAIGPDP
jgi:hypothetical protein